MPDAVEEALSRLIEMGLIEMAGVTEDGQITFQATAGGLEELNGAG